MFGERYFATRQRLSDVVDGVLGLSRDCGAALLAEDLQMAASGGADALRSLHRPFLFLVCGEVNAGKSSFLNGLFGKELCAASDLPETNRVIHYRWSEGNPSEVRGEIRDEYYRGEEFLRDFELVDTPGTNARFTDHLAVIEDYLRRADVLFFVFPVDNPWGAGTWQLVARLPEEQLSNAAFILQHSDLRDRDDLEVIMGHMRKLAEQKTGREPEIFPVSAHLALEAKRTTPMTSHLWRKSGYDAVERFITRKVNGNRLRREILGEIREATQQTLWRIEEQIDERTESLDRDQRFLAELENEVDQLRDQQATALVDRLLDLGEVFLKEGQEATRDLQRRMSLWQSLLSLFQHERLPLRIEKSLVEAVRKSVAAQAENDGGDLVGSCRAHWETVEPRIQKNLAVSPPDFEKETQNLAGTRERFVERLGESARQAVVQLKIRSALDARMEERRQVVRRYFVVFLLSLVAAGLLGGWGWHPWTWIPLGLGLLTVGVAICFVRKSRSLLCHDFMERIEDLRKPFADSLAEDYKEGVREFYLEYGGLFEIVRRRIADQKLLLKPRMERWNNLFLEIKAIEQEI